MSPTAHQTKMTPRRRGIFQLFVRSGDIFTILLDSIRIVNVPPSIVFAARLITPNKSGYRTCGFGPISLLRQSR
jgi:hypothetical protein